MSNENDNQEKTELKTEFVGCYVTESDKGLVEAMTKFLHLMNYIDKPYTSETIRFGLNLAHKFVTTELNNLFTSLEIRENGSEKQKE